ncbi:uncharacterized protein LOC117934599 isoform X1 [Etheostoma cragini]|uniref:uncharacterized protein LOC117934599 isoform X1 n=1 Tax=Etheostoma cragini TaxID=417921 RepID=UPI00155DDF1D|nr:uncharacterized protein LOC117934599 isoform X1 [Etheostoma cragini]
MTAVYFSLALSDPTSTEFKTLEQSVIKTCTSIYQKQFGRKFKLCKVKKFRAIPSRATGTEATIEVVFDSTTPIADLPENNVVAQVLVTAVSDPNNTFDVRIDPGSVKVVEGPVPTTAPTTAASTTAAPSTTVSTTAASTTVALTIARVSFRSVQSTFTDDLLNPSSTAFKNREALITGQLQPVFKRTFSSFSSLKVVSFRSGSVINTMDLSFVSTLSPNNTQISSTLINAASNINGFDIEGSSITVNGISSGGVSHKISLVTASCVVLLSWLL